MNSQMKTLIEARRRSAQALVQKSEETSKSYAVVRSQTSKRVRDASAVLSEAADQLERVGK